MTMLSRSTKATGYVVVVGVRDPDNDQYPDVYGTWTDETVANAFAFRVEAEYAAHTEKYGDKAFPYGQPIAEVLTVRRPPRFIAVEDELTEQAKDCAVNWLYSEDLHGNNCDECGGNTPEGEDPAYSHTEDCSQHVDNTVGL